MVEPGLTPTQEKLFALARAARARIEAPAGAAVVDETGRTYSAAAVLRPQLQFSALQVAAAQAASAGAARLHGAVIVGAAPAPADRELFDGFAAAGCQLLGCRADGSIREAWTAP